MTKRKRYRIYNTITGKGLFQTASLDEARQHLQPDESDQFTVHDRLEDLFFSGAQIFKEVIHNQSTLSNHEDHD